MEVLSINVIVGLNHLSYCLDKIDHTQSYAASLLGSLYNTEHIRRPPLTSAAECYKNGQKFNAEYYKGEKLDGLVISRYKSGKKLSEGYHKDGKLNGLSTGWCENGQIECEAFFKDGTEVDDTWTELDENERRSPSNASAEFIKEFCLTIFYTFLGVKLSSYIYDVWL
jgi:hypothetical protein